jgi:hypothetical protein
MSYAIANANDIGWLMLVNLDCSAYVAIADINEELGELFQGAAGKGTPVRLYDFYL